MLRFPDGLGAAARSQALVEPADLWATLLAVVAHRRRRPHSLTAASLMPIVRQDSPTCCAIGCASPARATSGRSARRPGISATAAEGELYAKPDDRWEVNNVSTRCLEVVECLQDALVQYEQAIRSGSVADLPPLSDVLIHGMD